MPDIIVLCSERYYDRAMVVNIRACAELHGMRVTVLPVVTHDTKDTLPTRYPAGADVCIGGVLVTPDCSAVTQLACEAFELVVRVAFENVYPLEARADAELMRHVHGVVDCERVEYAFKTNIPFIVNHAWRPREAYYATIGAGNTVVVISRVPAATMLVFASYGMTEQDTPYTFIFVDADREEPAFEGVCCVVAEVDEDGMPAMAVRLKRATFVPIVALVPSGLRASSGTYAFHADGVMDGDWPLLGVINSLVTSRSCSFGDVPPALIVPAVLEDSAPFQYDAGEYAGGYAEEYAEAEAAPLEDEPVHDSTTTAVVSTSASRGRAPARARARPPREGAASSGKRGGRPPGRPQHGLVPWALIDPIIADVTRQVSGGTADWLAVFSPNGDDGVGLRKPILKQLNAPGSEALRLMRAVPNWEGRLSMADEVFSGKEIKKRVDRIVSRNQQ